MTSDSSNLRTARLILRRWRRADREPFARMNRDPVVMENFPALLSPEESEAMIDRIEAHFAQRGFGLWAAELQDSGAFIGYIGLAVPRFEAVFTPCVEIGCVLRGSTGAGDWQPKERRRLRAMHLRNSA